VIVTNLIFVIVVCVGRVLIIATDWKSGFVDDVFLSVMLVVIVLTMF
jgi:hypothetical protein